MKWSTGAVKGFARSYLACVKSNEKHFREEGRIELWDIDAALGYRSEVIKHLSLADQEVKDILREADEQVLRMVEAYLRRTPLHYGDAFLFWHHYLDWVKEGYLKVEWDSQRGIYVGRLVKEPPRRRRRW